MKPIEEAAALLLGTKCEGFDPKEYFKTMNDEEKLRLIKIVKKASEYWQDV